MIDHAGYAVIEPDGLELCPAVAGIVPIAIMHAEIPGAVVSSEDCLLYTSECLQWFTAIKGHAAD